MDVTMPETITVGTTGIQLAENVQKLQACSETIRADSTKTELDLSENVSFIEACSGLRSVIKYLEIHPECGVEYVAILWDILHRIESSASNENAERNDLSNDNYMTSSVDFVNAQVEDGDHFVMADIKHCASASSVERCEETDVALIRTFKKEVEQDVSDSLQDFVGVYLDNIEVTTVVKEEIDEDNQTGEQRNEHVPGCDIMLGLQHSNIVLSDDIEHSKITDSDSGKHSIVPNQDIKDEQAEKQTFLYLCKICLKEFKVSSCLLTHQGEYHSDAAPYICAFCGEVFQEMSERTDHMDEHKKQWKLECSVCGKVFASAKNLQQHQQHGSNYTWSSISFDKNSSDCRRHEERHKQGSYTCQLCKKSFKDAIYLRIHQHTHPGYKPYVCPTCHKAFKTSGGRSTHMKLHCGEKQHVCVMCGRKFAHAYILREHIRCHTGEKPYPCSQCDKSFRTCKQYNCHFKYNHTPHTSHKCQLCQREFQTATLLKRHMVIHSGIRAYQCDVCTKKFSYSNDLSRHKLVHTGERPFKCDQCDKTYKESGKLTMHKRSHRGERPFSCDQCKKTFTESGNLKKHKRIHTGERPFSCDLCGKSFTGSSSCNKHKRTCVCQK